MENESNHSRSFLVTCLKLAPSEYLGKLSDQGSKNAQLERRVTVFVDPRVRAAMPTAL